MIINIARQRFEKSAGEIRVKNGDVLNCKTQKMAYAGAYIMCSEDVAAK